MSFVDFWLQSHLGIAAKYAMSTQFFPTFFPKFLNLSFKVIHCALAYFFVWSENFIIAKFINNLLLKYAFVRLFWVAVASFNFFFSI